MTSWSSAAPALFRRPSAHALSTPLNVALALLACGTAAHAGRPLSTDDAGTEATATCHLEAWLDKASQAHTWVVAPACGLTEGVELGLEHDRGHPLNELGRSTSVAIKWAPGSWALGPWRLGAKLQFGRARVSGEAGANDLGLTAIASWQVSESLALHANLGTLRHAGAADATPKPLRYETPLAVAAAWAPNTDWLLFAELTGTSRQAPTRSTGLRWWAVADRIGLDFSMGRQGATPGSGFFTVGLGWYGWGW